MVVFAKPYHQRQPPIIFYCQIFIRLLRANFQRMKKLQILTFFSLIFFNSNPLAAQMRGWEVGAWLGAANYFGDLNTDWRMNKTNISAGVLGRYNINERLAVRLGGSFGKIAGTDEDAKNVYHRRRNLSFKSNVFTTSAVFEFNFLPYEHGHREFNYTPYVFAGPSVYFFNPKTKLGDTWYELREYGTEGQFKGEEYNTTQGALSYGIGFKFDINYRWSVDIFLNNHKIFTDYLDDVSGAFPDMDDLEAQRGDIAVMLSDRSGESGEPPIGTAGRQRGNGKKNDAFVFAGIGMTYYFGSIRCPSIGRQ